MYRNPTPRYAVAALMMMPCETPINPTDQMVRKPEGTQQKADAMPHHVKCNPGPATYAGMLKNSPVVITQKLL